MAINWFKYSSPSSFYPLAGKMIPVFMTLAIVLIMGGLYWGFFETPDVLSDQKQYYRIIYVHVASAWMAMWLYVVMVAWAVLGLIFNTRMSYMMASIVPVIYYSINCPDPNECASLHQESSLKRVESNILIAMLVVTAGFWMYCFAVILMRVRNIILQRESHTQWVERLEVKK